MHTPHHSCRGIAYEVLHGGDGEPARLDAVGHLRRGDALHQGRDVRRGGRAAAGQGRTTAFSLWFGERRLAVLAYCILTGAPI